MDLRFKEAVRTIDKAVSKGVIHKTMRPIKNRGSTNCTRKAGNNSRILS